VSLCKKIKGINVLEDEEVREGIKIYNNWATIPQVFINKRFVGGADIIKQLFQEGELTKLLKEAGLTKGEQQIPQSTEQTTHSQSSQKQATAKA